MSLADRNRERAEEEARRAEEMQRLEAGAARASLARPSRARGIPFLAATVVFLGAMLWLYEHRESELEKLQERANREQTTIYYRDNIRAFATFEGLLFAGAILTLVMGVNRIREAGEAEAFLRERGKL